MKKTLVFLAGALLCTIITVQSSHAWDMIDSWGYTGTDTVPYPWIPYDPSWTASSIVSDDGYEDVMLPFTFNFYGIDYTQVTISANGYITFGGDGFISANDPIPTTGIPEALIAPFWDDLNPEFGGRGIHYKTAGTAPDRTFAVIWRELPHYYSRTDKLTFEAVLYESTNEIMFYYAFMTGSYADGHSASIGIENDTGISGMQYEDTGTPGPMFDGLSLLFIPPSVTPTITPTPTQTGTFTSTPTPTPLRTATPAPVHTIGFCDDFESGTLANWNWGGTGDTPYAHADNTLEGTLSPVSGNWVAFLGDSTDLNYVTATMDIVLDLGGESAATLSFWWVTEELESVENYVALDIYDGTWHMDVNGWAYEGESWEHHILDLHPRFTLIDGFIVRFRSVVDFTESLDAVYIDDVCVFDPTTATLTPTPSLTSTPTITPTPLPWFQTDSFGYTGTTLTSYSWIPYDTSWTDTMITDDDASLVVSLPFDFTFYGVSYSTVDIGSNGYMAFGGETATDITNDPIPDDTKPNNIICPYWDDLDPSDGGLGIHYTTIGTAPDRIFAIMWRAIPHVMDVTSTVTMETLLFENNFDVKFQYQTMTGPYGNGHDATVGIENGTGTIGLRYRDADVAGETYDGLAVLFTLASIPSPTPTVTPTFTVTPTLTNTKYLELPIENKRVFIIIFIVFALLLPATRTVILHKKSR